jgi:hypothetical protein
LAQTFAFPVIVPAALAADCTLTAKERLVPLPQEFTGVTVTLPAVEPKFTVTLVLPCPLATVAPVGTVQL